MKSNRIFRLVLSLVFCALAAASPAADAASGPIVIAEIAGAITPATDEYLKSALKVAAERDARLFILKLNTPGGLLPSMQSMVEALLDPPVPTVVYVSPQGGSAMSAGVFIAMAGHFAVMAPGTTIGAAHPVLGGGADIQGDMRAKIENYAVSLGRAIAERRGRNAKWAEAAVRESVAITDREAVAEKVVDFSASDIGRILEELEGKSAVVGGKTIVLEGLVSAERSDVPMTMRQRLVNFLADPNIAMLLGLGALLGIGIELLHPGAVLPAIFGAVCLVLSLIAGQVLPINIGGLLLLLLGAGFLVVEVFLPSFGIWGFAGIACLVLGSIYFIDAEQVWTSSGLAVDKALIGGVAAFTGAALFGVSMLAVRAQKDKIQTGKEGLTGQSSTVVKDFEAEQSTGAAVGKVRVMGELWHARLEGGAAEPPKAGDRMEVHAVDGLTLIVKRIS